MTTCSATLESTATPPLSWGRLVLLCALVVSMPAGIWSQSDTLDLPLPHGQDLPNPVETPGGVSLGFPDVIEYGVDYDETTGQYVVRQRLGDTLDFRNPTFLTLDEFLEYNIDENLSEFWTEMQQEIDDEDRGFAPKLTVDSEIFETIFGSNEIEIRPQGSAELNFGVRYSRTENPRLAERDRAITGSSFRLTEASETRSTSAPTTTPRRRSTSRTR